MRCLIAVIGTPYTIAHRIALVNIVQCPNCPKPFPLSMMHAGFDNIYATTTEGRGSPIPRTGSRSPVRSRQQEDDEETGRSRSLSPGRGPIAAEDVDVEQIRTTLRNHVQDMISTERERVSCCSWKMCT